MGEKNVHFSKEQIQTANKPMNILLFKNTLIELEIKM